jgi:hypothetical protein
MKSSYELAMERLNKSAPTVKISAKLKDQLAELDVKYAAKIAEREISLNGEIARAAADPEKAQTLREQLAHERKKLQTELEDKKERLRQTGK